MILSNADVKVRLEPFKQAIIRQLQAREIYPLWWLVGACDVVMSPTCPGAGFEKIDHHFEPTRETDAETWISAVLDSLPIREFLVGGKDEL